MHPPHANPTGQINPSTEGSSTSSTPYVVAGHMCVVLVDPVCVCLHRHVHAVCACVCVRVTDTAPGEAVEQKEGV